MFPLTRFGGVPEGIMGVVMTFQLCLLSFRDVLIIFRSLSVLGCSKNEGMPVAFYKKN